MQKTAIVTKIARSFLEFFLQRGHVSERGRKKKIEKNVAFKITLFFTNIFAAFFQFRMNSWFFV